MKLRKILSGAVATVACVAMLSTNVLAASVSIAATEDNGKLKVTIGGDAAGQVTFLATDVSADLATATGDDIQYIDQDEKAADGSWIVTFAKRAGGESIVNLYAGGDGVTEYDSKTVYVEATLAVDDDYEAPAFTYEESAAEFDANAAAELLDGATFSYGAIAATAAAPVTYSTATAANFTIGTPVVDDDDASIYNVPVTYDADPAVATNATASTTVAVEVKAPKQATAIEITNAGAAQTYYYDTAASEFTAEKAKELLKDVITVKVTYDDSSVEEDFDASKLTYTVGDNGLVTVTYGSATATNNTVTVALVQKAITGASATGSKALTYGTRNLATVTADDIKTEVENKLSTLITVTYTWNDSRTTTANDLVVGTPVQDGDNELVWTVPVTAPGWATFSDTITVTVEEKSAFGIKGNVTVANTTGQIANFESTVPVGAVVTAIPVSTTAMSYVGNVPGVDTFVNAAAYSTVVDEDGYYELELEPGDYHVIVSHSLYTWRRMGASYRFYTMRSIVDADAYQIITISDSDVDLINNDVALRYAYYGDMDLNGTLDSGDYGTFKGNFNTTVPAIAD